MNSKLGETFREARRILGKIFPLLISHHPLCDNFRSDMIGRNKNHLCKGCLISYPVALILILSYFLLDLLSNIDIQIQPWVMIILGSIMGSTQIFRAVFIHLPSSIKTIQKLLLGSGIAFVAIGIMEFQISVPKKILIFLTLVILYGILGLILRVVYIRRTCRRCKFNEQWQICDGLSFLYRKDQD